MRNAIVSKRPRREGFSLVEVCLAVLVVGLGILSVITLFPTGLAASKAAGDDTSTGLFTETVLAGLQARATEVPLDDWADDSQFALPDAVIRQAALNDDNTVAYYLDLASSTSRVAQVKEVTLYTLPWRAAVVPSRANILSNGVPFYTELFYMELP